MGIWLAGGAVFALGALVAYGNYLLSRRVLRRAAQRYAGVSVLRQAGNVVFLLAVYLAAPLTGQPRIALLLAAALGVTLPMFFFTALLLREQKRLAQQEQEKQKGEVEHG